MTLATILSRTQQALDAPLVHVEVHVGNGLPAFSIVGLPETAVKESKDRVRAALINCGFAFPDGRITVNLSPADLPKEGGRFDLPVAVGILVASDQLPSGPFDGIELYGELSLSGELRWIRGALPTTLHATRAGRSLILPAANMTEATLARGSRIYIATHLAQLRDHATGVKSLAVARGAPQSMQPRITADLQEVRGQSRARRALEIAAAGGHSLLLMGPPGSGKSMLAQRLPGILPPMTEAEALDSAAVLSLTHRGFHIDEWGRRPFRSPHHTASAIALVGGGGYPRPGEVSLAHHGVLFLDELPEFSREVLEVLREPIESGVVSISRAARQYEFPARFQLVAAMNPCPCGYLGDTGADCRCTPERVGRYLARISGPLLDRIDLHVEVPRVPPEQLSSHALPETSAEVAARVVRARTIAIERQACPNARLDGSRVEAECGLDRDARNLLEQATRKLALSARGYHRLLRVTRTIADLAGAGQATRAHLSEAITLRQLDRRLATISR